MQNSSADLGTGVASDPSPEQRFPDMTRFSEAVRTLTLWMHYAANARQL